MEARAGGVVHRAALQWSRVEPALIGEVRPPPQPMCRWNTFRRTHRRSRVSGLAESWQGRASSIFIWAAGFPWANGAGQGGNFLGIEGSLILGKGVPPTLARQKDVVLPQPLERGVNELLEPTSSARECRVPAPGGDVGLPWTASGCEGLASVGGSRAANDGGWNMASVVWRAHIALAASAYRSVAFVIVVRWNSSPTVLLRGSGLRGSLTLPRALRRWLWARFDGAIFGFFWLPCGLRATFLRRRLE